MRLCFSMLLSPFSLSWTLVVILASAGRKTHAKSGQPLESNTYLEYKNHWDSKICNLIVDLVDAALEWCRIKCNERVECTAFNHNANKMQCQLRACGAWPPMPTNYEDGWIGYSKYNLEAGNNRYSGPFHNYWSEDQCHSPQSKTGLFVNLVECMDMCDARDDCTGINFFYFTRYIDEIRNYPSCQIIACGLNPPMPTSDGKAGVLESYSKYPLESKR